MPDQLKFLLQFIIKIQLLAETLEDLQITNEDV